MSSIVETLNDICRICLKQDETVINSIDEWVEIIEVISQIDIVSSEQHPEKLCDECTQQLFAANEIRNLIIQSNAYFVKSEPEILDFVETKTNEITFEDDGTQDSISAPKDLMAYTIMEEVLEEEDDMEHMSVEILDDVVITNGSPYRCCFCDNRYEEWEELANHCMDIHKRELTTKNEVSIETHCSVCDKDFNSIESCNRHRICKHCNKFFVTTETFLIHTQKKSCLDENKSKTTNTSKSKLVKQHGCCKCSLVFVSHDKCKRHFDLEHPNDLYVGTDTGPLGCPYCLAPFISKNDLHNHLKAPRLKTYVCDQCNEQFPSFPRYKHHIEAMHNGTQEFGCDECEKVYYRLDSLRYHKYMHHNEKNNRVCPDCGKVFRKKVSFVEHRNIHLGLRPHICSICKNGFTSTGALRTHMRSHTGAKPFKCKYCTKRYSHYSDMKRHSYSHTGDYPYVCETCNKGFAKRSSLVSHQTTHQNR